MPRGRPKGSKNKRQSGPVRYSIGLGNNQFTFPIVREGNVSSHVALLIVSAESFDSALQDAVAWTLRYSEEHGHPFWPLVKYAATTIVEKRYVKRVDSRFHCAWAESSNYGCWLPIQVLEAL